MFFSLTDEQRALQSTVRDFLADRFPMSAVRAGYDDPESDACPSPLWQAVGEQGWLAVTVPEEYDGLGLGLLDAAVLARCWGEGCVPTPLVPTLLGAEALRLGGDEELASRWLPRVAAGEVKLAVGIGQGLHVDDDRLTGTMRNVEHAGNADGLLLLAGDAMWLVEPSAADITVTVPLDRTTRFAVVTLDGAPATRLDVGVAAVARRGAVLTANDLAGIADVALRRTVDYAKTREQFGRPIGSFQALKHSMADLHVATTMAGHAGWYAAHAVDAGRPDEALAVSVAKAKCGDVARDVTAAMIQYHGGIGYTWEHDTHFFFKRAERERHQYGDSAEHRETIASLVVEPAGAAAGG